MYGRGFTAGGNLYQFSGGRGSNQDYSQSDRERSPPRQRTYGSTQSAPTISSDINKLVLKEDYNYDHRGPGPGSQSGSIGHHDRGTLASDKTMHRYGTCFLSLKNGEEMKTKHLLYEYVLLERALPPEGLRALGVPGVNPGGRPQEPGGDSKVIYAKKYL